MFSSRYPTFAAVILAAAAGAACGPQPAMPAPDEIQRRVVVADLLADGAAETAVDGKATELRSRIDVPAGARLELVGIIPKHKAISDRHSVTFTAIVDGATVLSETRRSRKKPSRFESTVDLAASAGRTVDLELRIDEPRGRPVGHWRRATLETTETVVRQPTGSGPNLLFVVVDTLRADHCSLYGSQRPTTPFLEQFAGQATVFDQAVSQAPWTLPSVATMLTGIYPTEHGVMAGTQTLGFGFQTLAEAMQDAGVTTFAVSANPLVSPRKNFDQGFEFMEISANVPADEINRLVLDRLDIVGENRFFGYVHYMDPHTPYTSADPAGTAFVDTAYDGVFKDPRAIDRFAYTVNYGLEPLFPVGDDDLAYLEGRYDGDILFWDRAFEQLIAALDDRGLLDTTVIIVTADHGEEFLEHGMVKHGPHLYHESIHVPLIIRQAGGAATGARVESPFELIHLYEAALRLMGLVGDQLLPLAGVPGLDDGEVVAHAMPAIHPRTPWPRRRLSALMSDGWKLIYWLDDDRSELYNLPSDPGETENRIATEPEIAARLRQLLDEHLATDTTRAGSRVSADTDDLEQLRALGYVQ